MSTSLQTFAQLTALYLSSGGELNNARVDALTVIARHVVVDDETGCWNWQNSLNKGYGQITVKQEHFAAHRFSYSALSSPIKKGDWILHHCDNRRCVNPKHLYHGDAADNRRDTIERSGWRHPYGLRTHCFAGHEYAVVGFRIDRDGSRCCRECQKLYKRAQRAKQEIAA